jgi:dTDP-4-dehydrorhamnose 3,5-epimerase-like enzyme
MYNDFKIKSSLIFSEVKIITPDVFKDNRGFLFTDYLDSFFKDGFTPKP